MYEVLAAYPESASFRAASPVELGLVVLRGLIRTHDTTLSQGRGIAFVPFPNLIADVVHDRDNTDEGRKVASEAVWWLLSHDLIAEVSQSGANVRDPLFPTRLGRQIAASSSTGDAAAYALRAIELIPIAIRSKVMVNLVAGELDMAVTAAFKAVEVRMRERAALPTSDFGSRLARKFFERVKSTRLQREDRRGQLADEEHLFVGLFGMYRDRAVHEAPHIDSMDYALEVILSASHLLRIVESAELESITQL